LRRGENAGERGFYQKKEVEGDIKPLNISQVTRGDRDPQKHKVVKAKGFTT